MFGIKIFIYLIFRNHHLQFVVNLLSANLNLWYQINTFHHYHNKHDINIVIVPRSLMTSHHIARSVSKSNVFCIQEIQLLLWLQLNETRYIWRNLISTVSCMTSLFLLVLFLYTVKTNVKKLLIVNIAGDLVATRIALSHLNILRTGLWIRIRTHSSY